MNDKNLESIQRLRDRFLTESETNPQLYNPIDVKRVKTEDWQVYRFILDNDSEEDAYKELIRVLQWKHTYGLHERSDEYFPKEFFIIFGHEKYSRDKMGRTVTWNTEDRYKKIADFTSVIQQFLCYRLEQLDRNAGPLGWVSVNDCSHASMVNVDMNMNKFRTDQLNQYPRGLQNSLNVDMPWIMSTTFKLIKNLMSKRLRDVLLVCKREDLCQYVDKESIPECFGGNRECCSDGIKHLKSLKDCNHLGFNDKQIETFYTTYKEWF